MPPCIHRIPCALSRIPTYPRQLTYAHTLQNTLENIHLTAPSAVHLPTCFSSGSQLPGLSVKASLTLSPLQRFNILLNFSQYTTRLYKCQESILSLFFFSDDSFFFIYSHYAHVILNYNKSFLKYKNMYCQKENNCNRTDRMN